MTKASTSRVEAGNGLAFGERFGEGHALRDVSVQDGRVQRPKGVVDISPNNRVYDFTIYYYNRFKCFLKYASFVDQINGFAGCPHVCRRWLYGDDDQVGGEDDGLRQLVNARRSIDDDVGVVGGDRRQFLVQCWLGHRDDAERILARANGRPLHRALLGVCIDEQYAGSTQNQGVSEVDCQSSLANTAFLIE